MPLMKNNIQKLVDKTSYNLSGNKNNKILKGNEENENLKTTEWSMKWKKERYILKEQRLLESTASGTLRISGL